MWRGGKKDGRTDGETTKRAVVLRFFAMDAGSVTFNFARVRIPKTLPSYGLGVSAGRKLRIFLMISKLVRVVSSRVHRFVFPLLFLPFLPPVPFFLSIPCALSFRPLPSSSVISIYHTFCSLFRHFPSFPSRFLSFSFPVACCWSSSRILGYTGLYRSGAKSASPETDVFAQRYALAVMHAAIGL